MNAQLLNVDFFHVYMQRPFSVLSRFFARLAGMLALLMLASIACAVSVSANEYDIIIEKNLFHDLRQKWEMEKTISKRGSSKGGAKNNKDIDQINLFGTVIKDSKSYAVMRLSKSAASGRSSSGRRRGSASNKKGASTQGQDKKGPYAVGDFIAGYRLVEIHSESVLLQDPYDNERYEIFMNEGQTERTAVRTEIAEDKPERPPANQKERTTKRTKRESASSAEKSSKLKDAIRQRFENDAERIRDEKGYILPQEAERGRESQVRRPPLDEQGREELLRLKSEFEKSRQ